jgi:hypothetical protein
MVHVYEHTIVHSVVPMSGGKTVGEPVDAAEVQRRLTEAGIRIPKRSRMEPVVPAQELVSQSNNRD